MVEYSKTTDNLKKYRENVLHLSRTEMARRLGKSRQAYSKLEDGKTNIYNKTIIKMASTFDVDPQALLFDVDIQRKLDSVKEEYRQKLEDQKIYYENSLSDKDAEIERLTKLLDVLEKSNQSLDMSLRRLLKEP